MPNPETRKILEERLNVIWAARTPILWDDNNARPPIGTSYIRCVIDGIDAENISISCVREFDSMVIQVFTPKGEGSSDNLALCQVLVDGFRNYANSSLLCTKVINERVGNYREHYQRNVVIDVQNDIYS